MKEKKTNKKIQDTMFSDLFSSKENLLKLYKILLGDKAKKNIREKDINLIEIENVFINDLYNDLSFVVDNEIFMLIEAQSSYSKNIVTRILLYLAKTLEEYIIEKTEDKFPDCRQTPNFFRNTRDSNSYVRF